MTEERRHHPSRQRRTHLAIISNLYGLFLTGLAISAILTVLRDRQRKGPQCSLKGNQDMYGLGIRVGVYLQILTTALVDNFGTPQHTASLSPGNLWFLTALFIALSTIVWGPDHAAVEGYVIVSLGNGLTLIMLGGTLRLDPSKLKEPGLSSFARFVIWAIWKVYSASFWWLSLDHVSRQSCGDRSYGWFFGAVRLTGWFRTFHKSLNIVEWIAWLVAVLPYPVGLVLLALYVYGLDTSEWDCAVAEKSVSKLAIFVDYAFMPVGDLHDVVFGGAQTRGAGRVGGATQDTDSNIVRRRLRAHMCNRYGHIAACPEEETYEKLTEFKTFPRVFWFRKKIAGLLEGMCLDRVPYLVVWDATVLVTTTLTVELTLLKNGVGEVNYLGSAKQLVAFVVGLGSTLTAVAQVYVDIREGVLKQRRSVLEGARESVHRPVIE